MDNLSPKTSRRIISLNLFWAVLVAILLAGNILLGVKFYSAQKELLGLKKVVETRQTNDRVLAFSKLFITKVLKSETEVSFEDRLNLESAVRGLNDEQVLAQWQKFTNSKTEEEAQNEVKNLLELLVNKIKIN
jgi:multisubunit Na+/H+ antiporter MnhF subunit